MKSVKVNLSKHVSIKVNLSRHVSIKVNLSKHVSIKQRCSVYIQIKNITILLVIRIVTSQLHLWSDLLMVNISLTETEHQKNCNKMKTLFLLVSL